MSHIYVYSPSSAVRDKTAFKRGVARLKALGHEVELDSAALSRVMRFAGDDATRLAAIERAAASGADLALISRGGYGLTRLLPHINYASIASAIERGMHWMGVSDFTALQTALLAQSGLSNDVRHTWAGCDLEGDWGRATSALEDSPDEIMQACLDDVLSGVAEGAGWRLKAANLASDHAARWRDFEIQSATLWGGNLAVLCSLLGTPYFPRIKGGVLFLEDVGEHPYRIERMLEQLLAAGVLGQQKAILLGQFSGYKLAPHDHGFQFKTVVQRLRSQVACPVFCDLPYGHVPTKVCLPVGQKISLHSQDREVLLFW
jgi:muramoyltetrapeptide carboxypeptidase